MLLGRLIPRDQEFFTLFNELMSHLATAARLLHELFENPATLRAKIQAIKEVEHKADQLTHSINQRIDSSFVTPIDREDIYALGSGLDDVMDHMEEAVDLALLYEVHELPSQVAEQVEVLQRAAEVTAEAMPRLETMKNLEEYWIEINRLENAGDKSYRRILAKLFGGGYEALDVLKLKDIVESLEAAIDAFERVANTVEQIAVKES
jgi:predicted phosphate transport protein (TIGR00153 family)